MLGFFARVNYDYLGRYLLSERTLRWYILFQRNIDGVGSPQPLPDGEFRALEPAKDLVDNLKLRLFWFLGNQSALTTLYAFDPIRDFAGYTFMRGVLGKYSSLGHRLPDLTWETAQQWNLGVDFSMLSNRFNLMADVYIRTQKICHAVPHYPGSMAPVHLI